MARVGDEHVVDQSWFLDPEEIVLEIVHGGHVTPPGARHGHRHPAAEESAYLGRLGLHLERFQIMGHGKRFTSGGSLYSGGPSTRCKGPSWPESTKDFNLAELS
jgi:hypothetical protein